MYDTPIRTYFITGEKFLHRFARKSDGSEIAYPVCNYRDTLSAEAAGEDWVENGGSIENLSREDLLSKSNPPKIRKSGDMEIQITTPEECVNHLTIDGVLCSIECDIRNSEEFKHELEVNPDLALAWRDSSIVVEKTFAKRTGKFDDLRRSRSFCEFGEHTIDIEQHGGTVCYSHRDLNICARCYVQHVEEYFGVDAPGAAHERRLYGWVSDSDAAHERRLLKRQLRRAGVEWNRDRPNTADALRDQIRELGLEPMEVCFHRSLECPACVLPAGHEGPHEPATVKAAVGIATEPERKSETQKPIQKSTTNAPDLSLFD